MVTTKRKTISVSHDCPHCKIGFLMWDKLEKEPYCCICGWRRAVQITEDQAKDHFRTEREFWLNLFASERDPDEPDDKILNRSN